MAVKDTEPYLPDCLDSILDQSYPHWELLAVNDHSSDRSQEILDHYSENNTITRTIFPPFNWERITDHLIYLIPLLHNLRQPLLDKVSGLRLTQEPRTRLAQLLLQSKFLQFHEPKAD